MNLRPIIPLHLLPIITMYLHPALPMLVHCRLVFRRLRQGARLGGVQMIMSVSFSLSRRLRESICSE